ncbi:flagellar basal body rod protein FlgB [Oxalicibacterium faecigallinarum]|uniref:Flagellar basal body rod protein FlgB n=1 Tax=Oxalicibacterium faecigallinarum TaxID=573741 RepID=A0A8J3AQR2_9BURK|nr:flagellar basal body rod protein FlgB [Oxalicibacterium faecigallinarum]GGI16989.1 flagellar basal body rod protein FlgB [Oxalicibacterium faecigallinarum]
MDGIKNNGDTPAFIKKNDDRFWEASTQILERRMQVLASNIANADTPNYKARDIDFKSALTKALSTPEQPVSAVTQVTQGSNSVLPTLLYRTPYQSSIDGNTVEIDVEQSKFIDTSIRYQFSLEQAVHEYKSVSDLFKNLKG